MIKRENGKGSVYKLGGNRRKPYAVRVTKGFDDTGKQKYTYLGFFQTQQQAINALNEYNQNPFDLDYVTITFEEVFEKWKVHKYPTLSRESITSYNTSFYKYCSSLHKIRFRDLRLSHFQQVIDDSNSNYCTKIKIRILLSQLSKYCMKNDIVQKDYSMFVDIGKNEPVGEKKLFTKDDIQKLWDNIDMEIVDTILILLYTGLRISEMLEIEVKNVHLDEEYPYMIRTEKRQKMEKIV